MSKFYGKKGYTINTKAGRLEVITWKDLNTMYPTAIKTPSTIEEIQTIIKEAINSHQKIKAIGAGHSFTQAAVIADGGILISLEKFDQIVALTENTITVQAGCSLAKMVHYLKQHGKQIAACPEYGPFHAGAFSGTQLHESAGNINRVPTLASYTTQYTVVKADGSIEKITKDLEFWRAHFGNAGIVVDVTFKIMPIDYVTIEYDIVSFEEFWPHRDELPKQYDEYFTIYIPLLDIFFIERRRYVKELPRSIMQKLKLSYGSFLRKTAMVLSLPWCYSLLQSVSSYKTKKSLISFGVNRIFKLFFCNKTFISIGSDRAIVFSNRPTEIYNDFAYTESAYPQAMLFLREKMLQNERLAAATLIASYRIPQDPNCILSRTRTKSGFSIDPVLYATKDSAESTMMSAIVKECAATYEACPHLNKVTHLTASMIRTGYDAKALQAYLDWCHKQDPAGLFQGKFFQLLRDASATS